MGNLFACMQRAEEGSPPVEITVRANCCNSRTVKVQLDDLSHLPQVLELVRSLSKSRKGSPDSSIAESAAIAESIREPYPVKALTAV
jgi:hypothetical protein